MSAYAFRAAGTWDSAGSPGDPAGKTAGDLLLLYAAARLSTETINASPAGWTLLLDTSTTSKEQLAIFARIATGDASDTVAAHDFWSGTSYNRCQIAAFYGDVFTGGLGSIIAHSVVAGSDTNVANIPHSALTISTANCLVVGLGVKQKTLTSDGATLTDPAWIDTRIGFETSTGSTGLCVWGFEQQTTAANISADSWVQSVAESLHYASIVLALKTESLTKKLKLLVHADAQSDASVEGEVYEAPSGGELTGAKIGYFSGAAFEATLEGGKAVLKVPVADFGGSALTTSDTPVALVRTGNDTTGYIAGTVIEE